jgi:hypothetical protein
MAKSKKRKGNPVDDQIVLAPVQPPAPPSGMTILKVVAGVALVGGALAFFWKSPYISGR